LKPLYFWTWKYVEDDKYLDGVFTESLVFISFLYKYLDVVLTE